MIVCLDFITTCVAPGGQQIQSHFEPIKEQIRTKFSKARNKNRLALLKMIYEKLYFWPEDREDNIADPSTRKKECNSDIPDY